MGLLLTGRPWTSTTITVASSSTPTRATSAMMFRAQASGVNLAARFPPGHLHPGLKHPVDINISTSPTCRTQRSMLSTSETAGPMPRKQPVSESPYAPLPPGEPACRRRYTGGPLP